NHIVTWIRIDPYQTYHAYRSPVSSHTSRSAPCSTDSPGSTAPPGMLQKPLSARFCSRISPRSLKTAAHVPGRITFGSLGRGLPVESRKGPGVLCSAIGSLLRFGRTRGLDGLIWSRKSLLHPNHQVRPQGQGQPYGQASHALPYPQDV